MQLNCIKYKFYVNRDARGEGRISGAAFIIYNGVCMITETWKKVLRAILLAVCLLSAGCGSGSAGGLLSGEHSDMSDYILLDGVEHVYYDLDVETMVKAMKAKKTFAVMFGYPACEWCAEAVPVLNQAATEYGMEVGYINTRSNPAWEKNTEITDYDMLIEAIGGYLEYDSDGVRHLYTPTAIFIKDGEVTGFHEGTVPDHNARNRLMTPEEREELLNTYRGMFAQIQSDSAAKQ